MKTNGKKSKSYQSVIWNSMLEVTHFDLDHDDNGYTKVGWLIAHYDLRDYSPHERNLLLYQDGYGDAIHRNIWNAFQVMSEKGIKVYRSPNGHSLRYVTLDPDYREAKEMDFSRIAENVHRTVKAAIKEVQFKHPRRLQRLGRGTQLLFEPAGDGR